MKPIVRAGAHIAALWALAVAQPLFDVLRQAPEFFVAHRVDAVGRMTLAFLLALLVPAAIFALLAIVSLISGRVAHAVAASTVGLLAGVLAAQVAYRSGVAGWTSTLLVLSLTAVLAGVAWVRVPSVQRRYR